MFIIYSGAITTDIARLMRNPLHIILLLAGFICIRYEASVAVETVDPYTHEESHTEKPLSGSELLSVDVSQSDLGLNLLGTLTNGNESRALIKNPATGALGSFTAGDNLDIVREETVIVVEVSNCVVLLERRGRFETIECNNKMPTVIFSGPATLAKYKIVKPGEISGKQFLAGNFISDYDSDILTMSEKHGVDPYLVKAVIKAESNFDPNAVSPKNAQGMMQLIPETAYDYGVSDPFDPIENIEGGVHYLKDLLEYFDGDMKLSLAAYNAGKGAVIKHGFTIPPYPETTDYITKVLGYYKILKAKNYASKK